MHVLFPCLHVQLCALSWNGFAGAQDFAHGFSLQRMDECMDGWMHEWMDDWINEWMDQSINEWIDEWINGWVDEWMGR